MTDSNTKKQPSKTLAWQRIGTCLILCSFALDAFAITPSEEIRAVKERIIDYAAKNSTYLGMLGAGLAGTIMAFGAEVKKVIGNNLGYVGYVAFVGTAITGALTVMGMTV